MFFSSRITDRLTKAAEAFLEAAMNSPASNMVLERLLHPSTNYQAFECRNALVAALATDVEAQLGCSANMLFRSPGPLHDALQSLLDAFLDAADGIYYAEPTK